MQPSKKTVRNLIRLAFASALLILPLNSGEALQYTGKTSEKGTGSITGKVLTADGKSAEQGARVLAYHLSSERTFASEPSNRKGEFEITELPFGYFDMAIESTEGLFVANRVVNVAPAGKAAVIFTLRPYRGAATSQARNFPGDERMSTGEARFKEKPRGRAFWRSPRGVAVLAGIGSVTLLAIASGSDDPVVTPIFP